MSTLLGPADLAEAGPSEAVRVPLELVDPNPHNPRRDLIEIDALAQNIQDFGLLQPVTVRRQGERYELLGGHRRRAAFALLAEREPYRVEWKSIPAVVRSDDDDRAFLALISGQVHTRNWRPREEAAALERLVLAGRTPTQVGEVLHRGTPWASKRLRIYADSVLSGFVQSGKLLPGVAEEFLIIADPETRRQFAEQAVEERWSQDAARREVRTLRVDAQVRDIARRAKDLLSVLSEIDARRLPPNAAKDLWALHGRIEQLALGQKPKFPSLDAARKAAGVSEQPTRRPARGRPKRRAMPAPA